MFTKRVIQHTIWSRQRHNGFPIASRSVPVNFSLGPRSSLVRLSFVIRQSIEDRTRTERGTSKKRTKEQRISIEMPTRNYRQLDEQPPSWLAEYPSATTNQHTAHHPTPAEADSSTFSPTQDILMANQAFSTHSVHSLSQSPQKPLTSSKKPSLHQTQQPPKTHHPTHSKRLTTARQPNPPQPQQQVKNHVYKAKRAELSRPELCHDEKRYHKMASSS